MGSGSDEKPPHEGRKSMNVHNLKNHRRIERIPLEIITMSLNPLRPLVDEEVKRIAASMDRLGLMTPITVRFRENIPCCDTCSDSYELIAGRHRVAAAQSLGWEDIDAIEIECSDIDARLWEIAENLHRVELTKLQHDEQVAEWIRLTDEKLSQLAKVLPRGRGQPEGGTNAAAKEIGVGKDEAYRAVKVASLSPEAKAAAIEHGLDDNRTALLEAARESDPAAQVAKITERATRIPELDGKERKLPVKGLPDEGDPDSDIAPPEIIEENVTYIIDRINANAKAVGKIVKLSDMGRDRAERLSAAIRFMMKKWEAILATLEKKDIDAVVSCELHRKLETDEGIQEKLAIALRQQHRKQEVEFEQRVLDECKRRLDELILPHHVKKLTDAQAIIVARKGVMPRADFKKILACLHPDRVDDELKSKYTAAFHIMKELEVVLCKESELPTEGIEFPRTYAEMMARKQKVSEGRKARRGTHAVAPTTGTTPDESIKAAADRAASRPRATTLQKLI